MAVVLLECFVLPILQRVRVRGKAAQRGVSSLTPQEVSLTTTMRQMPGERGQPHERGLLHSPSPLRDLPS